MGGGDDMSRIKVEEEGERVVCIGLLMVKYFNLGATIILVLLTASLILLPLVLPPLPPPPVLLLLLPVVIMAGLFFLAFFPSRFTHVVVSSV